MAREYMRDIIIRVVHRISINLATSYKKSRPFFIKSRLIKKKIEISIKVDNVSLFVTLSHPYFHSPALLQKSAYCFTKSRDNLQLFIIILKAISVCETHLEFISHILRTVYFKTIFFFFYEFLLLFFYNVISRGIALCRQ